MMTNKKCRFCQTGMMSPDFKDDRADPYQLKMILIRNSYYIGVYDPEQKTDNNWVTDGLLETSKSLKFCPFCGRKLN